MLYYLLVEVLRRDFSPLNVFRYITVRTVYASLTAMFLALVFGPWLIRRLRELQIGQYIREEGPQQHQKKAGTPTMGGVLIVLSTAIPALLWADLTNPFILIALFALGGFAIIGFIDDYAKVSKRQNLGLTAKKKIYFQVLVSLIVGGSLLVLLKRNVYSTQLVIPFAKRIHPDLVIHPLMNTPYWWPIAFLPFLVFVCVVIVGSSNAVNLTDGLDGLAIGCTVTVALAYAFLTYAAGNFKIAEYLQVPFYPFTGELTVVCAALVGAGLGFLWFNCYPAKVFMGDTGSLSIGGTIGVVAICCKQEFLLAVVGGVFVLEAISVIMQVLSFQLTGRRIFTMSPLHHHFELVGWKENTVIVRFWILSAVFALLGLATLKLR